MNDFYQLKNGREGKNQVAWLCIQFSNYFASEEFIAISAVKYEESVHKKEKIYVSCKYYPIIIPPGHSNIKSISRFLQF